MPKKKPELETFTLELACKLTREELTVKGQELARMEAGLLDLQDEKREVAKDFAAKIEGKKGDIHRVSHQINTGHESRAVQCYDQRDEVDMKVMVIRTDTGEVVSERMMTAEERQRVLFGPKDMTGTGGE